MSIKSILLGATVLILSASANAAIINFTLTGDGVLFDENDDSTNIGVSTLSFQFDTALFTLTENISFSGGTGKKFSSPEIVVTVTGGGDTYIAPSIVGASIFDQPNAHDQFNFENNAGGISLQWNDFSSSAFTNPLPTSFDDVYSLFIDQVTNNPQLSLANGGAFIDGLNGGDGFLEITNGVVNFSVVPIPATAWFFGSGLLGLIGIARRKKA